MEYKDMKIDNALIKALKLQGITKPTPVQQEVLKMGIHDVDLIVQSETGSGKTLAYLVPLFEKHKESGKGNQVIILVPTHELAMQVDKQVKELAKHSGYFIQSAVIMGDVNIERQVQKLKDKPQFIIGTSGRILELIKRRKIAAHLIKTIVIDEADKLLNKDNITATKAVVKCTLKDRRLLFFSASMPQSTVEVAKEMSVDYELIRTSKSEKIPSHIEHWYILVDRRDKIEVLRKLVRVLKSKKAMIFINKVSDIEEATHKLVFHEVKADCIHGSNLKTDRKRAVEGFRNNKINYLIATDIAARGIHFDGIDTVFHLSIPEDPVDYLHRAGRTGRNDHPGRNVLLVTKEELANIKRYQKAFGINIIPKKLYQGKIVKG